SPTSSDADTSSLKVNSSAGVAPLVFKPAPCTFGGIVSTFPSARPYPKLATQISLASFGLMKMRSGWRNGYPANCVNVGVAPLPSLYHNPCSSVARYISPVPGRIVTDSQLSVLKIRLQCNPRSTVLYSPPMSLPFPPQPLRTAQYQVFCAASFGSMVISLV